MSTNVILRSQSQNQMEPRRSLLFSEKSLNANSPLSRTSITANVGSVVLTSSRIFSERDLAESRLSEAIVVIGRACVRKGAAILCKIRMRE